MRYRSLGWVFAAAGLSACVSLPPMVTNETLKQQVADTERAFAKTMADRDHAAFASFIAEDAVFFSGSKALCGKQVVVDTWQRFYAGPAAPFSWAPETVEVLDSGALALSSGPVKNPQGEVVATFTSIWRREAQGTWRIVFDKGNEVCDCQRPVSK